MIYIIGFMGVGKSTIAQLLAKKYKIPLVNIDQLIEKNQHKSITEIFQKDGEEKFRIIEKNILKNIQKKSIVDCGGGLPIYQNNMLFMKKNGVSIYLKANYQTIYQRVKEQTYNRPLLTKNKNLIKYIKKELEIREQIYKQAEYIICTDNLTTAEILRKIDTLPIPF